MGDISTDYYEFQIVNWYCTDVEVEPNEDDDDYECKENQLVEKYIIKLFGVDASGKSIGVSVCDFTPHFYVKIERPLSPLEMDKFQTALRQHMGYMGRDNIHIDIRGMSKKDFWGFSNNKMFHFIRLCFDSFKAMKAATRAISSHKFNVIGLNQRKFKLYESNIEPFLRFAHIKNIQPAGWVRIPKKKTTMGTQILPCKCELDLETKWKNIESVEKDEIAPLLVASFDLECMSCDGDFPVPIKNYQKIATEIYNLYHDTKSKSHDSYELKEAMHSLIKEKYVKGLVVAKSVGSGDGKKNTVELLQNVWLKYQDHVMSICKGDTAIIEKVFAEIYTECFVKPVADGVGPENILRFHGKLKKDGTSGPVLRKSMVTFMNNLLEKNKTSLAPNINVEEKIEELLKLLFGDKDGIINILTRLFDRVLVPLEGDEIIQIGTTFHRYGQSECSRKIIFSLGTCDQLADNIEVVEFDNEAEMILAWTDLINDSNPDIITGYNIFGFDFNYIYNRALELGCQKDFCKIGRLHGHSSLFKTAKLSSSALGDNIMKFIDMEGRTLIDLMKVVQRDHKLDSFKLDNVASHFMGMNKNDVSPQDIFQLYRGNSADRARVADYCVQDCALCNKLMMKLEIVANNVGMANVCSVPLSWIFMRGQGVKIFSLVAKECKNMGYLIPVIAKGKGIGGGALFSKDGDVPEEEDAGYEGAIVLEPKTGIYTDKPITIFDYASLYPSSMISENISHDSIVLDEKYDNLPGVTYLDVSYDLFEKVGDEKRKIGEQVCRYVQPPDGKKGIIPNILMHLLKQRKITRKKIGMQRMWFADGSYEDGFYTQGCGKIFKIDGSCVEIDETLLVKKEDVYNTFQKAVLDGLQLAYKITANSLYGQVGASTSPIYMKDLAASTTATGRKMIMLAKDFMEKEYNAEIVYGDSVTGDTPLLIKYPSGIVDIRTIETLCDQWDNYRALAKNGDTKQQGFIFAKVWANGNWADIKRVIRHKTKKQIYRVNTFSGCVDVTEDHSLIGVNGQKICPGELEEGVTELKHSFPTEFIEHDIQVRPFDVGDDSWVYEKYDKMYECTSCWKKYDVGMYYMNGEKRGTKCKLCVKKRACERLGKPFDGKIGENVLKYQRVSYTITKFEAWVWGFFFSDGSCGKYGCASGLKTSWAIHNSNLKFLDKAQKYLENIEDSSIVKFKVLDTLKSSGVYKLVAAGSPKYMVEKYRELFYDKDDYKKIPSIILNAPYEIRLWFFRGYLTADGTKKKMAKGKWDFACKGKIGAQGLYYLMQSLGYTDIRVNINFQKQNTYCIRNIVDKRYLKKYDNKVITIQPLDDTQNELGSSFVYDIETEDGVFHGGVGAVVLVNTDSLFCTFPHINTDSSLSRDEVLQKTYAVALKASEQIKPLLKKPHDLEYEKIFYPMILFSKKRYCANKYEHDLKKFKQISMGIALKRRDNANIVKKIYGGIIDIILNEHDVEASIKFLRTSLEDLLAGKYPLEDFIITKTLKGHYKDPSRIAHKVLAERIKERTPGNAPQVNDRIPYAYIEVKNEKCLQGDRIEHPDYIREKKLKVDYSFYLTNQIQNPVLQLYALILEQLPKYKLQQDYWKKTREALVRDGKSRKFIDDKIADMREQEARKLLCEDVLNKMKLNKTGQRQVTDFWRVL